MARAFLTLTQDEIDAKHAEQIHSRELELLSYDYERSNHEAALAELGDLKWDGLEDFKGLNRDQAINRAVDKGLDAATIQKISDLQSIAHHRLNLHAVTVETAKSERHYKAALKALPDDRRAAAIKAHKEKIAKGA